MNDCAIEMPCPRKNKGSFKNYKNEIKIPFIIYADTERRYLRSVNSGATKCYIVYNAKAVA